MIGSINAVGRAAEKTEACKHQPGKANSLEDDGAGGETVAAWIADHCKLHYWPNDACETEDDQIESARVAAKAVTE